MGWAVLAPESYLEELGLVLSIGECFKLDVSAMKIPLNALAIELQQPNGLNLTTFQVLIQSGCHCVLKREIFL